MLDREDPSHSFDESRDSTRSATPPAEIDGSTAVTSPCEFAAATVEEQYVMEGQDARDARYCCMRDGTVYASQNRSLLDRYHWLFVRCERAACCHPPSSQGVRLSPEEVRAAKLIVGFLRVAGQVARRLPRQSELRVVERCCRRPALSIRSSNCNPASCTKRAIAGWYLSASRSSGTARRGPATHRRDGRAFLRGRLA